MATLERLNRRRYIFSTLSAALLALPCLAWSANYVVTLSGRRDAARIEPEVIRIQPGDSVTWKALSGTHNVEALDGTFRCAFGCDHLGGDGDALQAPWSVTLTFSDPGEIPYRCRYHHRRANSTGTVIVGGEAAEPPPNPMPINFGHGGSWYEADQDGQGFSFEVVQNSAAKAGTDTLVAYWFTFSRGQPGGGANRQRWFQGVGPINDTEALLDIYRVTGGVFDDTTPVASEIVGTATVSFSSCTEGTLAYSLDLDGNGSEESANEIALTRLTPDVLCEEMAGN